jgi:integrase
MIRNAKPAKPYPDFPLFAHASGQWAKKIGGKLKYFGKWDSPDLALAAYADFLADSPKIPPAKPGGKASETPSKRRPMGFPLYLHRSGQWARKVNGKTVYFGVDQDAALRRWINEKDTLLAGQVPARGEALTVEYLCDAFMAAKRSQVSTGELEERSWQDYFDVCKKMVAHLGASTSVLSIGPVQLAKLREQLAKGQGAVSLTGFIGRCRVVFNFAYKNDLIDRPVKFGDVFKKPSRKVMRKAKADAGPKMFEAKQIRTMLENASPQLQAMILLGVNAGLGNSDCARLTTDMVQNGQLIYPRPKTGVDRMAPLWPETLEAIQRALEVRPMPRDSEHRKRVFITKYGRTWEGVCLRDNPVAKEFRKLLDDVGFHRKGLGFYTLRRVCQTIGGQIRDTEALRLIMGHVEDANDMGAVYNQQRPSDERLLAVTNHIRKWLFPPEDATESNA